MAHKKMNLDQKIQEINKIKESGGGIQDGGLGRHTAPPRTTRTDRKLNSQEVQHQGNKK